LEESGTISSSDAKTAASQLVNYQESATEEIGVQNDELVVLTEDEVEVPSAEGTSVNIHAMHKVYIVY
jgi:hypothetical protein